MEVDKKDNPAIDVLEYLEKMAEKKLDDERRREESIIQQATNMQTAFAFSTAALFMVATIIYDYRGDFSYYYFFSVFATITAFLLLSLVFATKAQRRMETVVFPTIMELYDYVNEYWDEFQKREQRIKYNVECCSESQQSLMQNNELRVSWLRRSMRAFYISIIICVIWTVITIIIVITRRDISVE